MLKWILYPLSFALSVVTGFLVWAYWWATKRWDSHPLTPEYARPKYRGYLYE